MKRRDYRRQALELSAEQQELTQRTQAASCGAGLLCSGGGQLASSAEELETDRFDAVVDVNAAGAGRAGGFQCQPGALQDAMGVVAFDSFGDADANR